MSSTLPLATLHYLPWYSHALFTWRTAHKQGPPILPKIDIFNWWAYLSWKFRVRTLDCSCCPQHLFVVRCPFPVLNQPNPALGRYYIYIYIYIVVRHRDTNGWVGRFTLGRVEVSMNRMRNLSLEEGQNQVQFPTWMVKGRSPGTVLQFWRKGKRYTSLTLLLGCKCFFFRKNQVSKAWTKGSWLLPLQPPHWKKYFPR